MAGFSWVLLRKGAADNLGALSMNSLRHPQPYALPSPVGG